MITVIDGQTVRPRATAYTAVAQCHAVKIKYIHYYLPLISNTPFESILKRGVNIMIYDE